jgi:hypothetical protein
MNSKEISLVVLLVFGVLTAFASFKMHLNLFSATGHSFDFFHHTQQKWTKGALFKDVVLHTGVCPFGKFGAWANFLWSFLLIGIILVYKDSKDLVAKKRVYQNLYIIQLIVLITTSVLSLSMNWPLAVRSIPFFGIQIAIAVLLAKMAQEINIPFNRTELNN